MMNYIKLLTASILAGVMIAIGGTVYLSIDNKIIGSMMFSIGLITILYYGLSLFTGRVGYLIDSKKVLISIKEIIIIWIGNFIGTWLIAKMIYISNKSILILKAVDISYAKLSYSYGSIFLLSCLCGLLRTLTAHIDKIIRK